MSRLLVLEQAVDEFAEAMKKKLRVKAHAGKKGWSDPNWPVDDVIKQLRQHIEKGDPVDVANYSLFWWWKCEGGRDRRKAQTWDYKTCDCGFKCSCMFVDRRDCEN